MRVSTCDIRAASIVSDDDVRSADLAEGRRYGR
jgi:hypothetical protein